jgi:hypothetical protein
MPTTADGARAGSTESRQHSHETGAADRARDPESGHLRPRHCQLYIPGHSVHWIQAKKSYGEPHREGRLTAVSGDVLTVEFGDEVKQYRNCDPDRLLDIVGIQGRVSVCERYSILRTPSRDGHYVFCIVDPDEAWVPCDYSPLSSATPAALAERLETHGGFFVSGQQVLEALADDEASEP